jgi:hypothetical protein
MKDNNPRNNINPNEILINYANPNDPTMAEFGLVDNTPKPPEPKKPPILKIVIFCLVVIILIVVAILLYNSTYKQDKGPSEIPMNTGYMAEIRYDAMYIYSDVDITKRCTAGDRNCSNETPNYFNLIFNRDGSFIFQHGTSNYSPIVGTYVVSGDVVSLSPKVTYELGNGCFRKITDNNNKLTFIIRAVDELLYNAVLVDANGNYKTKNISMKITGDVYKWDSYFSVNPVNGTKPTGYDKPWIECGY